MILVFLIWSLAFFVFFVLGFSIVKLINRIAGNKVTTANLHLDEYFFMGFLTLATLCGYLSIWIPIGYRLLIFVSLLSFLLFIIYFKEIRILVGGSISEFSLLKKPETLLIILLAILLLTVVIQKVTWYDTGLYHAQSIQWIQKYAVVPGLGNIHGRLATNSMFFVICGLFTFKIKDILIFPLNGICYVVLIIRLLSQSSIDAKPGSIWKSVMYIVLILISLITMIPTLNSASPDIICGILIIYAFILLINHEEKIMHFDLKNLVLFNLLVFNCISFKVSSLFLIISLVLYFDKDVIKRGLITIILGILIFTPYLIRNYYLSGYLIYPFPSIDIFNVDWKIPIEKAIDEKAWIVNWAKIPGVSYLEVINLKVSEWIIPWFKNLSDNNRIFLLVNSFSIITFIIMVLKKDYFLASIQFIILINLIFWFLMAPDPRFAYGFIIFGFSLTIAFLIKILEYSKLSVISKYFKICLTFLLLFIIFYNKSYALAVLRKHSLMLQPEPFETVETKAYNSGFDYRIPVNDDKCFNAEIPCVPYQISNVVLRGTDLQDGFKVVKK